jgi:hypothetical protein
LKKIWYNKPAYKERGKSMDNYEDNFKKVSEDIIKAVSKLEYNDIDSNLIKVNIMMNLNNLLKSYDEYTQSIDILMKSQGDNRQKSLRKDFR